MTPSPAGQARRRAGPPGERGAGAVFGHGQLRLYLLTTLARGPQHGYEIIRRLQRRLSGLYTPSPGTVYPRLAKLTRDGLVIRADEGRKATYSLTAAGFSELAAREPAVRALEVDLDRAVLRLSAAAADPDVAHAVSALGDLAQQVCLGAPVDSEVHQRVRRVLREARHQLDEIDRA